MRALINDKFKNGTVTATNESLNYPADNLIHQFLRKRFQSTAEISVAKLIMEAAADVNSIAHGWTNADSINSQFYKSSQFIGQDYTNLVQDPTDLRAAGANWTAFNTTDEISTLSINGNLFTKIINDGANAGFNYQSFTAPWTTLNPTFSVIAKKGSSANNTSRSRVRNITTGFNLFNLTFDWDNFGSSPGVPDNGTILEYNWIDSETLELFIKCDSLDDLTDNVNVDCFGSNNAANVEYTYWTEVALYNESDATKITSGLQSQYHFAGDDIDSYGSNNATPVNSPTFVAGISGQARKFDGVNQYLTAPIVAIGTQDFWVSFWFEPDLATHRDALCGMGNPVAVGGNGWKIEYRGDLGSDPLLFAINDSQASSINMQPLIGDVTGSLQHVVLNVDRNGDATIYLNKNLIGTLNVSGYTNSLTDTTLYIGTEGTASVFGDSAIDEFEIGINALLTTGQIEELFNNPPNLIGKTLFPFVDGTHSADVIDETFTMGDIFSFDMVIDARFAYDMATNTYNFSWYIDATHEMSLRYAVSADKYVLKWHGGTSAVQILSQQFGDGFTELNQRLRLIGFLNTISGGQSDSALIIIPLESGAIFQGDSWSGTPDIKDQTYTPLSIGWDGTTGLQADSVFEYLRFYGWDGIKPTIPDSDAMTLYLVDKTILFEFEPDDYSIITTHDHDMSTDPCVTYFDKLDSVSRVDITIQGPDPVYLGGVSTDEYLQLEDPLADYTPGNEDNSIITESPYGQTLQNYIEPLRLLKYGFRELTEKTIMDDKYKSIGIGKPVFWDLYEENRDKEKPIYGKIVDPLKFPYSPRRYSFPLTIKEAR